MSSQQLDSTTADNLFNKPQSLTEQMKDLCFKLAMIENKFRYDNATHINKVNARWRALYSYCSRQKVETAIEELERRILENA